MPASLFTAGQFRAFTNSGAPLAGGKVYTYAAGTTTPLATYTTQAGTVANANPVILDAYGRASIWLGSASYRMIVKTSADVTLEDNDNVNGSISASTADFEIARAKRFVVGYDDDSDITNNTSALTNNSMLLRYSTAYSNAETKNGIQIQRYIEADIGERGNGLIIATTIGTDNPSDTPTYGSYQTEWGVNVEIDSYSTLDPGSATVGVSSTVRRYSTQQVIGMHCNAMDMRIPSTATDSTMGGITGLEAHSDAIGPDHRTSGGDNYGYRTTIRCAARTQSTLPTWTKRGTAPMGNSTAVALDAICVAKNATLTTSYEGPYFVCTTAGTTGVVDTCLDATTTPGATVTDGSVVWECRVGAEIGMAIKIINGGDGLVGYYRYGIVIDNGAADGNLANLKNGIYITNSGTTNYESYGAPTSHFTATDTTGTCDITLASEVSTNNSTAATINFKADDANGAQRTIATISGILLDNTAGTVDGKVTINATIDGAGTPHLHLESGNVVAGDKAVLATTATAGFLHIGRCAGAPTGVPSLYTGKCPMVVDSTNGRLYVYHSGAWHYTTLT